MRMPRRSHSFSGDENGVYISDGNIPEIPEKLRNSNGEKLQAMFQCGIMYINGYVGYLCAEIYSEHHVWKQSKQIPLSHDKNYRQ